jgi:hypothetical protein
VELLFDTLSANIPREFDVCSNYEVLKGSIGPGRVFSTLV